jgi:hypothetical protein
MKSLFSVEEEGLDESEINQEVGLFSIPLV